jgi:hypothetical protein
MPQVFHQQQNIPAILARMHAAVDDCERDKGLTDVVLTSAQTYRHLRTGQYGRAG